MKSSVKIIVLFVLLMLSFSMRGEAMAFAVVCDEHRFETCNDALDAVESSSDSSVLNDAADSYVAYGKGGNSFSFSDVELGFKSVTETYSFGNSQRMRRAVELSDFFKGLSRGLCLRENLLVLDKRKSYLSDKDLYMAQPSCKYYVFALRRILI